MSSMKIKKVLKIRDFLNYICKKHLLKVYPNLFIALLVVMACLIFAASAERSFGNLSKPVIDQQLWMIDLHHWL